MGLVFPHSASSYECKFWSKTVQNNFVFVFTSIGRSGAHDDVNVGKNSDSEFEVFVVSSDVLSSGDLDVRFRNRDDVDVESVVFKVNRFSGDAMKRRGKVNQTSAGSREFAGVQIRNLFIQKKVSILKSFQRNGNHVEDKLDPEYSDTKFI